MRPVMVALFVLLTMVPAGQALTIQADSPPPLPTLQPDEPVDQVLTVTVVCQPYSVSTPKERALIHEGYAEHSGVVVTGQQHFSLPDDLCTPGGPQEADVDVPYSVSGSMDVPGEEPIQIDHTFSIQGDDAPETTATERVVMGWQSVFTAVRHDAIQKGGPQKQLTYDVTITNHGNSRSEFHFELVGEGPAEGDVILPAPVVLDSPNTGQETTKTVTVRYATPFKNGSNQANETFAMRIIPESTKAPDVKGEGQELEFTGVTDGVYVPTPLALAPIAVALAAAIRRRS